MSTSGGASRIRLGVGLLTMKPAAQGGGGDLGRRARRKVEPDEQARAADLGDPRVGGEAVAELLAEDGHVLEQVLVLDGAR